jgi:hypothetical protein
MRKVTALIITAVFSAMLLCGCSNESSNSSTAYEDLPYGSTMRQLLDGNIDILFDGRFITDDEMKTVSNYYYSIETSDEALFKSTLPELYIKYLEEKSGEDISGYMNDSASQMKSSIGENFKYESIEATDCGDKSADSGITDIIDMLNGIYKEYNAPKSFEDTIKDAKYLKLNLTATSGEDSSEFTFEDQIIYIFNCEDGIYII